MSLETSSRSENASRSSPFRRFIKILGIVMILVGAGGSLVWLAFTVRFLKDPARYGDLMASWTEFLHLKDTHVVMGGAPVTIGTPVAMGLMLMALLVVAINLGLMIRSGIALVDFVREKRPATPSPGPAKS